MLVRKRSWSIQWIWPLTNAFDGESVGYLKEKIEALSPSVVQWVKATKQPKTSLIEWRTKKSRVPIFLILICHRGCLVFLSLLIKYSLLITTWLAKLHQGLKLSLDRGWLILLLDFETSLKSLKQSKVGQSFTLLSYKVLNINSETKTCLLHCFEIPVWNDVTMKVN